MKRSVVLIAIFLFLSAKAQARVNPNENILADENRSIQLTTEEKEEIAESLKVLIEYRTLKPSIYGGVELDSDIIETLKREGFLKEIETAGNSICIGGN